MSFDWRKLGHFDLSLPSPWSSLTTPEKTHIQTVRRTFFHNCCLKMSIWIMEDTDYYTTSSKFMWMTSFTVSEGVERKWLLILFPAAAPYVPHVYAADFSSAGLPSVSNACVCVCVCRGQFTQELLPLRLVYIPETNRTMEKWLPLVSSLSLKSAVSALPPPFCEISAAHV